jgi:hypothetical protein
MKGQITPTALFQITKSHQQNTFANESSNHTNKTHLQMKVQITPTKHIRK